MFLSRLLRMQEFYWDTAYLAFQRVKLAELNVAAVAKVPSRIPKITGSVRAWTEKDAQLCGVSFLKIPKVSCLSDSTEGPEFCI